MRRSREEDNKQHEEHFDRHKDKLYWMTIDTARILTNTTINGEKNLIFFPLVIEGQLSKLKLSRVPLLSLQVFVLKRGVDSCQSATINF